MKRHIQFLVVALASGMFGGCAAVGSTSAIATPWGAAGMRTFAPSDSVREPSAREVDASVARLLDEISVPGGSEQLAYAPLSPPR